MHKTRRSFKVSKACCEQREKLGALCRIAPAAPGVPVPGNLEHHNSATDKLLSGKDAITKGETMVPGVGVEPT